MARDHSLSEADIPNAISRKLEDLEIKTVRQFHARLEREGPSLQQYLGLSDAKFADLRGRIEDFVAEEYPEDQLPRIRPSVNKTGVAVHRLDDPTRPKYGGRGKE